MSIKQAIEALGKLLSLDVFSDHDVALSTDELDAVEEATAALAALRSMPAVASDWVASLKIDMEASAWDGVIQLDDALKNIDDALAATPHTEAVRMSEEEIRRWWSSENGFEDLDMCKIDDFRTMVRAVEQATAARLGVKMGDV